MRRRVIKDLSCKVSFFFSTDENKLRKKNWKKKRASAIGTWFGAFDMLGIESG